jgi:hypothetical protein
MKRWRPASTASDGENGAAARRRAVSAVSRRISGRRATTSPSGTTSNIPSA